MSQLRSAGPALLPSHHRAYPWIALLAGVVMIARSVLVITSFNHTIDEPYHLASAIGLYESHRPWLHAQHPPLARLVMGLPLWLQGVRMPILKDEYIVVEYPAFHIGRDMMFTQKISYWRLLISARLAMQIFAVGALVLVYRIGRYLINPRGGMIATVLFSLDPTFLGHAPWVGTDVAGCATFLAGFYFGLRWIARPGWMRAMAMAVAVAAAIGTKYSGLLLIPSLLLIGIARIVMARSPAIMWNRLARGRQLAVVAGVGFITLWTIFLFDVAPLRFNALKFAGGHSFYARLPAALRETPLPMPSFWLGYLFLDARVTHGHPVYFNGKISRLGSRFYFTEAMLVKCTIGFLCMMLLAALALLAGRRRRLLRSVVLLLPIGFYFTLSTMTKYQLGIRHLLPILPLLCVFVSLQLAQARRLPLMLALMALCAVETAAIHPDYLSFFNFVSGGPRRGERYLIDSNLDWGQDIARLSAWLKSPVAAGRSCTIEVFNASFDPKHESAYPMNFLAELGLDPLRVQRDPQVLRNRPQGLFAVSKNVRHRLEGAFIEDDGTLILGPSYDWLDRFPVVGHAGYSIDIYDLDHPEVAR